MLFMRRQEQPKLKLTNWSLLQRGGDGYTAPELCNWYLQGNVYGHPRIADGTFVTTSRITNVVNKGKKRIITTRSGSVYYLSMEEAKKKKMMCLG